MLHVMSVIDEQIQSERVSDKSGCQAFLSMHELFSSMVGVMAVASRHGGQSEW